MRLRLGLFALATSTFQSSTFQKGKKPTFDCNSKAGGTEALAENNKK